MINIKKIKLISEKEKKWYAVYTKSHFEKKVNDMLIERNIAAFLPLQKKIRQWSDRKKTVEVPLLKSYVFAYINNNDYLKILEIFGVVKFITYLGKSNPAPIPDEQIDNLKIFTKSKNDIEIIYKLLNVGDKVEVVGGAFNGLTGELIEYHGNKKIVVKINHLNASILITVPTSRIRNIN